MGATSERPQPKPTLDHHIQVSIKTQSDLTYNFYETDSKDSRPVSTLYI